MQGFWNKLFTICCESYKVGVSHVTRCCKNCNTQRFISKKRARTHVRTHTWMLLLNWYWATFPYGISVTNMAVTCVTTAYVTRQESQLYLSVTGGRNRIEQQISVRVATTITTAMILNSSIPTVIHNSRHYSVQTACRCSTWRYISSLVIELPTQSVATNTDFSSRIFMSCFAADIPLVVQTNWYCQLYFLHWMVSQNMKCTFRVIIYTGRHT